MPGGIETLHPDVYVIETKAVPKIVGVGVSTGGFVGFARKGPIGKADLVTNFSQYVEKYGSFYRRSFLPHAVRAFFAEGGKRCFVSRIVGLGAVAASRTLDDLEGGATLAFAAQSPGAWGDDLTLTTRRWEHALAEALADGATSAKLASVRFVEKGDLVVFIDPATGVFGEAYVKDVAVSTRTISFQAISLSAPGATIPAGSPAQCSTAHRAVTELVSDLATGATEAELRSTFGLNVGARVTLDDGAHPVASVLVTSVSGRRIKFAALAGPVDAGAVAATQEFHLLVTEEGAVVETHQYLSMEETNVIDYVGKRLAGSENESKRIEVTDLFSTPVDPTKRIPEPLFQLSLEGGDDGATPTVADYIGSEVPPRRGIFLFDEVDEVNMISTPGITAIEVTGHGIDYCERRGDCVYIAETPLSDDEPLEAQEYRQFELNKDSSYGVLYYPWLVVPDPEVPGARLRVPPSGWMQGQWAETASQRGVHVAPANVTLRGVIDLTHRTTDGEQDILNPIGVNVIRSFPGQGIRIWGARTLWSTTDGRHYVNVRRLLNFIEESIEEGNRWAVFEPNDPKLWRQITRINDTFLRGLWQAGMLFPSTDVKRAFFVKCDEETNPMSEIRQGRVWCEIGVNPPFPAEFVIFRVGVWDGGSSVEEEILNR